MSESRMSDSQDWRYRERLAASFGASLVLHLILALLIFTVVASSSQQGASESVPGGLIVTVERRSIAQAKAVSAPQARPPQPFSPRIAPIGHAPQPQRAAQRLPQNRHELAKEVANASPNPRPVPQASSQPNPQPTAEIIEPQPTPGLPAVPVSVPTASAIAVTVKVPPTAAPSPAPSAAARVVQTPRPPQPSAAPQKTTATPAPAAAVARQNVPVAAQATAGPIASAVPGPRASAVPAAKAAGIPSPGPISGANTTKTQGLAPSPGPQGIGSPGPRAGSAQTSKAGPPGPVRVSGTPKPSPSKSQKSQRAIDINARLRALLPHNKVSYTRGTYAPGYRAVPTSLDPTPPPDVIARTKYLFMTSGSGTESRTKMWVTAVRPLGLGLSMCTGWLVRWPQAPMDSTGSQALAANGIQLRIGGGHGGGVLSTGMAGQTPIIEPNASYMCSARRLVPFGPH
jgi:hypothetical protein